MISYVLLVSIVVVLSIGIFSWLKVMANVQPEVDCKPDTSVIIEDYSCNPDDEFSNLQLVLKNNGRFNFVGQGRNISIRELSDERKEIIAGKINARTGLNLTAEDIGNGTVLRTLLSNGRNAEIKIMPDRASETALARLRLRVCSEENNCRIELKELTRNREARAGYEMQIERHSRILGIFKKKMLVRAEVDAEDGEVIRVNKPWWAFLAREPPEVSEE